MTRPHLALACSVTLGACGASQLPTQAAADPSASPVALAQAGDQAARRGDLVRAEQYLASALRADPDNPRLLHALLHVCIDASRLRAAIDHARAFLVRHPDAWRARYLLACLLLSLGHRDAARHALEEVAVSAPHYPETYYQLATLSSGAPADALYARYLALAPDGPHALQARVARAGLQRGPGTTELP